MSGYSSSLDDSSADSARADISTSSDNTQSIELINPHIFSLNPLCWGAIATLNPITSDRIAVDNISAEYPLANHTPSLSQQRLAVRQLLHQLLTHLSLNDGLDDSHFPFRLSQGRHFVCFSHSGNKVAVLLHPCHPVGIDIETQAIKWKLVKRFFHPCEVTRLADLELHLREQISGYLWQIKECVVKVENGQLIPTLGQNYAMLVDELIPLLELKDKIKILDDDKPVSTANQTQSFISLMTRLTLCQRSFKIYINPKLQLAILC